MAAVQTGTFFFCLGVPLMGFLVIRNLVCFKGEQVVLHQGRATPGYAIAPVALKMATSPAYP
jgi:hypothetical protein